jgi:hypothetical protein
MPEGWMERASAKYTKGASVGFGVWRGNILKINFKN